MALFLTVENSAPPTVLQHYYLQVETDLNALSQVLSWLELMAHAHVPHAIWLQWKLAITEGFTNAVRHAHKGYPTATPIALQMTIQLTQMDVQIWDQGPPFDLQAALDRGVRANIHAKGGRGLFLMEQIADEIRYDRTPAERNCLRLRKIIPSPDDAHSSPPPP